MVATLCSADSALGLSRSCSALCDGAADVLFERGKFIVAVRCAQSEPVVSFDESARVSRVERFWFGGTNPETFSVVLRVELIAPGDGGLVDPVPGDGLGEHIQGRLVVFDNDVGVVAVASSGHRGVDTPAVGGCVEEEESVVDGSALGGVAGLGVAEFEMLGYVLGWEPNRASASGEIDAAIGVDRFDGPVIAVFDHQPLVGAEATVVAAGDRLIAHQHPFITGSHGGCGGVEFASLDPGVLGEPVEPGHGVGAVRHHRNSFAPAAGLLPRGDDVGFHLFEGVAVETSVPLVLGEDGGVAISEAKAGGAFPVVSEAVYLVKLDSPIDVDQVFEHQKNYPGSTT